MKFLKTAVAVAAAGILGSAIALALVYGGMYLKVDLMRRFMPEVEDIRTEAYRNTRAYREGSIRDLRRLAREYEKEDQAGKAALRTIIQQRADELDYDDLPSDVQRFLESM